MEALGKKKWAIPAGYIPLMSTGKEPGLVSQDRIAVLNTSDMDIKIKLTVFYTNQEAVSDYSIEIKARRLRTIRINDLINPLPVFLKTQYALLIEAEQEVVVQFLKMNTAHASIALMGTMGFGTDKK